MPISGTWKRARGHEEKLSLASLRYKSLRMRSAAGIGRRIGLGTEAETMLRVGLPIEQGKILAQGSQGRGP